MRAILTIKKEQMKVMINNVEVEVEIKTSYTRKIDREFNSVLFNGVNGNIMGKGDGLTIDPMNIQRANDYLIKAMTNLSEAQIDELEVVDYNKILEEVGKIKEGSK